MELTPFFKSVLEQDTAPVVLCDLEHTIIYMNETAAQNYHKYGGYALLGRNLKLCHNAAAGEQIDRVVAWFAKSPENNRVYTFRNEKQNKDVYMIALRDEEKGLIGYYEKHEFRDRETMPLYRMD